MADTQQAAEPQTYVMQRHGIFRYRGTTYGPREAAGVEITTAANLPKLYPGLFKLKGEVEQAPSSGPTGVGVDATEELSQTIRELAGVLKVAKIGATYIAMGADGKVLATGSLDEIEKALA